MFILINNNNKLIFSFLKKIAINMNNLFFDRFLYFNYFINFWIFLVPSEASLITLLFLSKTAYLSDSLIISNLCMRMKTFASGEYFLRF